MGQPISRDECAKAVKTVQESLRAGFPPPEMAGNVKSALGDAADRLGLRSTTVLSRRIKSAEARFGMKVDWSLWKNPEILEADTLEGALQRENKRLKNEIKIVRQNNKRQQEQLDADESIKRLCFGLAEVEVKVPEWAVKAMSDGSPGTPMLHATDFQWGEVVNKNEMDGINEFNSKIAERRYRTMIEKTIDICFNHTANPKYDGIYYLRGGDMVSGSIHEELEQTNDLHPIAAVRHLVECEIWGITQLADAFGKVHVKSVAGNHGRSTRKKHSKKYAETNFDTLSAYMIQSHFEAKGDKRVTFETSMSADIVFDLHGFTFCLSHGDRMGTGGGQGFIGVGAPILRGMQKLKAYWASLGITLDYIIMGHYHEAMDLGHGYSGGSLPGMTEYGRDYRFIPRPPVMWLLWIHPKVGVVDQRKLFLEDRVKLK